MEHNAFFIGHVLCQERSGSSKYQERAVREEKGYFNQTSGSMSTSVVFLNWVTSFNSSFYCRTGTSMLKKYKAKNIK